MTSPLLSLMLMVYLRTVRFISGRRYAQNHEYKRWLRYEAAVDSGYNVCIISGGSNEGVRVRLRNLGITDIHLGSANKVETFEYTDVYNIKPEQVLYMETISRITM
jgi:hypothetical protein